MNGVIELMESAQAVMPPFVEMPAKRACRGAACPLFAVCQGRCETRRRERTRREAEAGRYRPAVLAIDAPGDRRFTDELIDARIDSTAECGQDAGRGAHLAGNYRPCCCAGASSVWS